MQKNVSTIIIYIIPISLSDATKGFVDNNSGGNAPSLDPGVRIEVESFL